MTTPVSRFSGFSALYTLETQLLPDLQPGFLTDYAADRLDGGYFYAAKKTFPKQTGQTAIFCRIK